jgi:preprotein translocase subunit SecD
MYIVLEVDLPTLMETLAENKDGKFNRSITSVRNQLKRIPEANFFTLFTSTSGENNLKLSRYYYDYGSSNSDIIVALEDEAEDAINRVLEILVNRVDQFGVAEPTIQKQGDQRIIVELAGVQDSERARTLLESTALLEFFIVKDINTTNQLMIRIDQVLKGDTSISAVTKTASKDQLNDSQESDDQTVSVSELFGETEDSEASSDSAVVDENIFAARPFSAYIFSSSTAESDDASESSVSPNNSLTDTV